MRLGQLARKLALRPADIVEFLAENNIVIADNANTRLKNEETNLVMKRFVPGWTETADVEEVAEPEEETTSAQPVAELVTSEEDTAAQVQEVDSDQDTPKENAEIIRAPKIELSGLKVVGKIDLPEPKKKEETSSVETTDSPEVQKERREPRRAFDPKRKRPQRSEKNPIALQRENEAKEAQRKREEERLRDKEKRTQNYLKNYKPAPPTKAAKLVKEDVIEMTQQELAEPPKTIFGKIIRWLTKAQ